MIKLNNLTVAYNDNTVISDLTYEFAKGSTAITGSSGIGKTSLINAILSLVPYKGTIAVSYTHLTLPTNSRV